MSWLILILITIIAGFGSFLLGYRLGAWIEDAKKEIEIRKNIAAKEKEYAKCNSLVSKILKENNQCQTH